MMETDDPSGTLTARLRHAAEGAPGAIHALRVTTRRLDVWLRLAQRDRLRDDLRWLRHAAGPVRDLDVLVAREWTARDARRLRALRGVARRALRDALASRRVVGLVVALGPLPPPSRDEARDALRGIVRAALRLSPPPDDLDGLHRARRAARRVRYALEWLGEGIGPLGEAQDTLGLLSDATLAERWLGPAAVDPTQVAESAAAAAASWAEARPFLDQWR